jgi:O-succinylbenzoate synthase
MTIISATVYQIDIPLRQPFTTSFGTITTRPTIIVKAETSDGLIGWGEAAPLAFPIYKPETVAFAMITLQDYLAPLILGKEFQSIEDFNSLYQSIKGNYFAKTGFETAAWMLLALERNVSISQLIGGTKKQIETGISVGIGSVSEIFDKIETGLAAGTKRIKLKIRPDWDLELVKQVRTTFGDIPLMVDANSAYTLADIELFKKLDTYRLLMIEQPLADDDIIDHSVLQQKLETPICLDESISSVEDARRAIYLKACKIINIKPGRVGGLLETKKIHDLCQQNNVGVWCGGMMESGIARAFNIATASQTNYIYPADMDETLSYFTDDVLHTGYHIANGLVEVPAETGLGFMIDEEKIIHYTTQTLRL